MAKPFNQKLHDDINMLHGIDRVKYPGEYRRAFGNIMKRYKISRTTVYNELDKAVPGKYKERDDNSRHILISPKEIAMVKDMVSGGKTIRHISRVMSLELGFRYTPYRILKVKELIASGKQFKGIGPIIQPAASTASARLLEEGTGAMLQEDVPDEAVVFKGNIRRLFYRLSMLHFIDPARPVKIDLGGNIIYVSTRAINLCFGYMIYSAMHEGRDIHEIYRFEMENILIHELEEIRRGNKVTPAALKQLEGIRKSLLASAAGEVEGKSPRGGYDMDDIFRAVTHFAPGTPREDVEKLFAV